MAGINPLQTIIELKDGVVLSPRWEKLDEMNSEDNPPSGAFAYARIPDMPSSPLGKRG